MPSDESTPNEGFLGGPAQTFDQVGREQASVLLDHGLLPESRVLDFGCGCLRGGRWIIPLIAPGHYCGIEPMEHMVERGLNDFVDPGIAELKRPRFDHNDQFDGSVFGGDTFDFFIARSVWSHASKRQIGQMLDTVRDCGNPGSKFFASWRPALPGGWGDYKGDEWVGKSHESAEGGTVQHSLSWIKRAAAQRGLRAERVRGRTVYGKQPWCLISKP